jgi:hypothetical protein
MKKNFKIIALMAFAAAACSLPVWSADAASDAAQVKMQASSTAEIKALAAATGGYKSADVEFNATAHQITITVVNSKLNKSSTAEREAEATRMVTAITGAITEKPAFSQLAVIHLDYVERTRNKLKPVQRIDFFQSPAGVFVLHKT